MAKSNKKQQLSKKNQEDKENMIQEIKESKIPLISVMEPNELNSMLEEESTTTDGEKSIQDQQISPNYSNYESIFSPLSPLSKIIKCPLPPRSDKHKFTLVLDLDETLIHAFDMIDDKINFYTRPYCQEFLKLASVNYEIIIFTASQPQYADSIIDQIDPCKYISYRLYRNSMSLYKGRYVKDLSLLGRTLESTVIVDNMEKNYQAQPKNGYKIPDFYGHKKDRELYKLAILLNKLVEFKCEDIRFFMPYSEKFIEQGENDSKDKLSMFNEINDNDQQQQNDNNTNKKADNQNQQSNSSLLTNNNINIQNQENLNSNLNSRRNQMRLNKNIIVSEIPQDILSLRENSQQQNSSELHKQDHQKRHAVSCSKPSPNNEQSQQKQAFKTYQWLTLQQIKKYEHPKKFNFQIQI